VFEVAGREVVVLNVSLQAIAGIFQGICTVGKCNFMALFSFVSYSFYLTDVKDCKVGVDIVLAVHDLIAVGGVLLVADAAEKGVRR
jgi:hypothetical protein